ncbi:MAG TPA: Hsp70 family protein [Polyangiales bacterium]
MASPVLGIDLGTTNSVVAVADSQRVRVLRDEDGQLLTPSTVSFHPSGQILVGHPARERRLLDAEHTVFSVKRLIGRPYRSAEVRQAAERLPFKLEEGSTGGVVVRAREETYSLPEISSFVLRTLRNIAEQALGQSCVNAVITVPANFNELQRMATRDAGRIAGLNILRILNEPTAAALAYGYRAQTSQRIAVYDLGGGTFDISILELSGDVIEVVATAGDTYLGGDDIDRLIADRMVAQFLAEHHFDLKQDVQAYERVCLAAEWVKCQLSMLESAEATVKEVAYADAGTALDLTFRLSRADLDQMIFKLIGRTFDICEEALRLAGLRPAQLDGVLLVGGQTRTPKVRAMVGEYFGMEPQSSVDPDLVVAQGAALQGYALSAAKPPETARPSARTLSGPPPSVRPQAAAAAPAAAPDAFDDEPTKVASRSDAAAAALGAKPSDTPFDDLPTTVATRSDSESTKIGDAPVAPALPAAPAPAPGIKSTLMGVGSKAPPSAAATAAGLAKPPALANVIESARQKSGPARPPPVPTVSKPSTTTLAETPGAKAGMRPSQMPSARGAGPAVPKTARVPIEAAAFPLAVDDEVTQEDLPSELKAELRPTPSLVAPPLPSAPTTKTLAETPKAKAAVRASVLPPTQPTTPPPVSVAQSVPSAAVPVAPSAASPRPALAEVRVAAAPQPAARMSVSKAVVASAGPSVPQPAPVAKPSPAAADVAATQSQFPASARAAAPLLLLDVTPHTLAVETAGGFCESIIGRNAPIPTEQTRIFSTSQDNQVTVSMRVCQGESRRTDDNQVLGKLDLVGLRQARRGEVSIAVQFMIDADGTLNVKATDRTTGKAQAIKVSLVGAIDDAEIGRMRARQGTSMKPR